MLLVGDGPERKKLERLAVRLGIRDRVLFAGIRDDVGRLLTAMDVFVLSSASEGLPLVVLEAMAAELPVVASAVGGIPAVIEDGRNGLLVEPTDDLALRDSIARILCDPLLARSMGRRARATVLERYSSLGMCHAHLALYAALLQQRRTKGNRQRAA